MFVLLAAIQRISFRRLWTADSPPCVSIGNRSEGSNNYCAIGEFNWGDEGTTPFSSAYFPIKGVTLEWIVFDENAIFNWLGDNKTKVHLFWFHVIFNGTFTHNHNRRNIPLHMPSIYFNVFSLLPSTPRRIIQHYVWLFLVILITPTCCSLFRFLRLNTPDHQQIRPACYWI